MPSSLDPLAPLGILVALGAWVASWIVSFPREHLDFYPMPPEFESLPTSVAAALRIIWAATAWVLMVVLGPVGTLYAWYIDAYRDEVRRLEDDRIRTGQKQLDAGQLSLRDPRDL